ALAFAESRRPGRRAGSLRSPARGARGKSGVMRRGFRHLPAGSRIAVILLLAAGGFASWWWLGEQRALAPEAASARHPDSYFREIDIVRHDADGKPEMRVRADYAEHYETEPWIHLQELEARDLG